MILWIRLYRLPINLEQKAFVVGSFANDTVANGTEYAGYLPATTISGSSLVLMTNEYGSDQSLTVTCDNELLANLLGISDAATEAGMVSQGKRCRSRYHNRCQW